MEESRDYLPICVGLVGCCASTTRESDRSVPRGRRGPSSARRPTEASKPTARLEWKSTARLTWSWLAAGGGEPVGPALEPAPNTASPQSIEDSAEVSAHSKAAGHARPYSLRARARSLPLPMGTLAKVWPRARKASNQRLTAPSPPKASTPLAGGWCWMRCSASATVSGQTHWARGAPSKPLQPLRVEWLKPSPARRRPRPPGPRWRT